MALSGWQVKNSRQDSTRKSLVPAVYKQRVPRAENNSPVHPATALNSAYCERFASTPYHVMFGRALLISFSTLASSTGEDWKVDALNEET